MHWNQDENEAFPARHPREPGGLRQDILDEIADHLACAAAAEEEQSGETDETTRWQRARERFGDPEVIARRLWWDSMRETIMREWIQTGVLAVLAVAGIAGVVFMGLMLRQFGATNEAVLTALSQQQAGEARWATLELEFRRGSADGPLASGVEVACIGKMFGEDRAADERTVDASGTVRIGPMQPGVYTLKCSDSRSGLHLERDVMLYASGTPAHTVVVVPDVEPREVEIQFDLPIASDTGDQLVGANITSKWEGGGEIWRGKLECIFSDDSGRSGSGIFLEPSSYSMFGPGDDVSVPGARVDAATHPIRVAGTPDAYGAVVLRREEDLLKSGSKYVIDLEPESDSNTRYRAVPDDSLAEELQDWALYDQMTAQGLSVTKELVSDIRRGFSRSTVVSTMPVERTTLAFVADRKHVMREETGDAVYEMLSAKNLSNYRYSSREGDFTGTQGLSPLFLSPRGKEDVRRGQRRLILAFYCDVNIVKEYTNPLEAWSVTNDIFSLDWRPAREVNVVTRRAEPNLKLGTAPLDSLGRDAFTRPKRWLFMDVTDAFAGDEPMPGAILLQWKCAGEDYENAIGVVSAEAKNVENEHRHPLWLVLEPKEEAGEAT